MKSTGKHKYNLKDQNLPCDFPGCGRFFKSPQALFAHRRMVHHQFQDKAVPDSEVKEDQVSSEETIKVLRGEVSQLKLEKEKRQLTAELPSTAARSMDLMEQAGLGSLEGRAKDLAQMRALGVKDQGQAPSWLDKLLSSPGGIKTAIDGLRGILNINNHQGDNTATLLKSLGFDLKSLILGASSPKAGALSIAGVDLQGVNLSPELLQSILAYKGAEVKAAAEFEGKKSMADSLQNLVKLITPEVISRFSGGRRGNGAAGTISQEIIPEVENIVVCDLCGAENKMPADLTPGQTVKCQGENCSRSWVAEDPQARQPKPERVKRQVEVKEAQPATSSCPGCGQLIDLSNRVIGEAVKCPVCQEEYVVKSEDLAILAEDGQPEEEKQRQQFLHR